MGRETSVMGADSLRCTTSWLAQAAAACADRCPLFPTANWPSPHPHPPTLTPTPKHYQSSQVQVMVFAFDCLYVNGASLLHRPLTERREAMNAHLVAKEGELAFATAKTSRDIEELAVRG
jgi:hypothetical protein